jgi:hypothetical protein
MDFFCGVVPSNVFASFGKMLQLDAGAQVALHRLSKHGLVWAPSAGNLFTLLAFTIGIALNSTLMDSRPEAVFMLAPLLLLLSQDPFLFRALGEQQRYAPPISAASGYLAISTLAKVYGGYAAGVGPCAARRPPLETRHRQLAARASPAAVLGRSSRLGRAARREAPLEGAD